MGGRRKSSGGCRDVFECARALSNVNLSKETGREGRSEPSRGLRFMYVFFNVNLSGEQMRSSQEEARHEFV